MEITLNDAQFVKIDTDQLKQNALMRLESILFYLFPAGDVRNGKFYVGDTTGCRGKSLVVDLYGSNAGLWHDFETGEGGDIFTLWGIVKGIGSARSDFPKIVESISEYLGVGSAKKKINGHNVNGSADTSMINDSTINGSDVSPREKDKPEDLGRHSAKWDYYDADNQMIACVYRYDTPEGKQFRPWDIVNKKNKAPEIRPLYRIPEVLDANTIILVEGEKCADALHSVGLTATTAMNGAKAPLDKTDWSPLEGKSVIVWPDNDDAGKEYGKKISEHLKAKNIDVKVIDPLADKPEKWDCADAVAEGMDVKAFVADAIATQDAPDNESIPAYNMGDLFNDKSAIPDDLIAPRVLTPGGIMVFAGAPKVGKSDFLLSWLVHMAAGKEFLEMKPPRPLRIFYLQAEIGYHYLRERVQKIHLDGMMKSLVSKNIVITPQFKMLLDDDGVTKVSNTIKKHFSKKPVDIIVIDPLRNVFDACGSDAGENDNMAMLSFLQNRVDALRDRVSPDAGVILVHHTKKIQRRLLEEDPFQALSGAGSLRAYYSSGLIMYEPDETLEYKRLVFELRNGPRIENKIVAKQHGAWENIEFDPFAKEKTRDQNLKAENRRKKDIILQILYDKALEGKTYTFNQFREMFEHKRGLGGKDSIRGRLENLDSKGYIQYFNDYHNYKIYDRIKSNAGLMCVEGMRYKTGSKIEDSETGEMVDELLTVYPTHYKDGYHGSINKVQNKEIWIYRDEDEDE